MVAGWDREKKNYWINTSQIKITKTISKAIIKII
jgi:hypothetical protein